MTRQKVKNTNPPPEENSFSESKPEAEKKPATSGLGFLVEASKVLNSSLDYEVTLKSLSHVAVPGLADWCTIDIVEENGKMHCLGAAHTDPIREPLVQELSRRYWTEFAAPNHVATRVLKTGKSEARYEYAESAQSAQIYKPEHRELLRRLGVNSVMVVPLIARQQTIGVMMLVAARPGHYFVPADLEIAEELAHRAALAIDNARLYREAQEAIKAREEFLSVAAHELKTPITGLKGYVQLLTRQLNKTGTLDPQRAKQALSMINQQSDKIIHLLAQLLDISRIESGRLVLETRPTELRRLIDEAVAVAQMNTAKHRLEVEAPAEIVALVDPMRFEQVIVNLLDNAIKYSPEGGQIRLEMTLPDLDTIHLTITDQGLGIPPEHRPHIFDRFYQAHQRNYLSGMGLGLYITRQIIELHGGSIEAEFPEEGGTRFIIRLPRGLSIL